MDDWQKIASTLEGEDQKEFIEGMKALEKASSLSAAVRELSENQSRRKRKVLLYILMIFLTPFALIFSKEAFSHEVTKIILFTIAIVIVFSIGKIKDYYTPHGKTAKEVMEDVDIYVKHKQFKMAIERVEHAILYSPELNKIIDKKLNEVTRQYEKHLYDMR
jgi:hypothetical protein